MSAPEVPVFRDGGYRFIKGVFQYSGGVAAEPGFRIERARLRRPLPLAQGFAAAEVHLKALGRPVLAFCACELRSPKPFTEEGFVAFNRHYTEALQHWGIYRDGVNPVARTNVCPDFAPPAEPSLYAFSYTVPATGTAAPSFIVSGGGEAPEGKPNYRDHIVRRGDTSREGMRDKLRYVFDVMVGRMTALGVGWNEALDVQVYTVHDIGPLAMEEIVRRGAAPVSAITWHLTRPPVVGLDCEMDVRAPAAEHVIG
jgi:hypothetical protein